MMLPGFFDNHVHAGGGGGSLMEWKGGLISEVPDWLLGITENDELYAAIRARSQSLPPGEWVRGSLSREVWPNQTLPDRWDLDDATADRPVYLTRGPHTSIMNSRVLEMAGITRETEFIGGGEVGKDENGEPDGRLFDAARRLVADILPSGGGDGPNTFDDQIQNLRARMLEFASDEVVDQGVENDSVTGALEPGSLSGADHLGGETALHQAIGEQKGGSPLTDRRVGSQHRHDQ